MVWVVLQSGQIIATKPLVGHPKWWWIVREPTSNSFNSGLGILVIWCELHLNSSSSFVAPTLGAFFPTCCSDETNVLRRNSLFYDSENGCVRQLYPKCLFFQNDANGSLIFVPKDRNCPGRNHGNGIRTWIWMILVVDVRQIYQTHIVDGNQKSGKKKTWYASLSLFLQWFWTNIPGGWLGMGFLNHQQYGTNITNQPQVGWVCLPPGPLVGWFPVGTQPTRSLSGTCMPQSTSQRLNRCLT